MQQSKSMKGLHERCACMCMYVFVCVCMRMYTCIHVCMYAYVYMYVCMDAYVYMYSCVYTCVCIHVRYGTIYYSPTATADRLVHWHKCKTCIYMYSCQNTPFAVYMYVCRHAYVYMNTCVHIRVCLHVFMSEHPFCCIHVCV